MPKLLQICVEGNTGSTGTIAESIGQLVMNIGWDSYIAYGRYPRPSKSKLIRIGSDLEVLLHGIETRIFDRHGLGSRRATKKLVKQIEDIKPDIIHLHHIHGYYINMVILCKYLSKAKIPVVWTFHDCWSFTGHCGFFDFVGCEKWKTECNNCPQKREYPASLFFDRSKENYYLKKELFTSIADMVIVSVSKWLDNLVSQSFFKSNKHTYIYNGIDIEVFKPSNNVNPVRSKYNLHGKYVILGVASTWERRKGLSDFIELSKLLNQDEVIILIGLDQKQKTSLPRNVIGLSRTENKMELVDLYSASDVYLNLSVEETFGLTTAEAMACGTPVIVYNRTASPELVNINTGIVVEKNDFDGLIKAMEIIRGKGKDYYSAACRTRVVENFNENDRFNEYINLYEEMIKSATNNVE